MFGKIGSQVSLPEGWLYFQPGGQVGLGLWIVVYEVQPGLGLR